jgi:hypothetical protein
VGDTHIGDLFESVIATWDWALDLDLDVEIELVVEDFGGRQLGEAVILEFDDAGRPARGVVTIDNDANGQGWYSSTDDEVPADRYDLETALLHEVGHVLGFTPNYSGFRNRVEVNDDNQRVFRGGLVTAELDARAEHLDPVAFPNDLMNPELALGQSKDISLTDVGILRTAYYAAEPRGGTTGAGSPLMAAGFAQDSPARNVSLLADSPVANVAITATTPAARLATAAPIAASRNDLARRPEAVEEVSQSLVPQTVLDASLRSTTDSAAYFDSMANASDGPVVAQRQTTVRAGLLDRAFAGLTRTDAEPAWESIQEEANGEDDRESVFDLALANWGQLD